MIYKGTSTKNQQDIILGTQKMSRVYIGDKLVWQKSITPFDAFELTFNAFANIPVANPLSVIDWNTFFDLPNYGNPFTEVVVTGALVKLYGGGNITMKDGLFGNYDEIEEYYFGTESLISINDKINAIIAVNSFSFANCSNMTAVALPNIMTTGLYSFLGCNSVNSFEFPSLITAGIGCFHSTNAISYNFISLITAKIQCFANCKMAVNYNLPLLKYIESGCFINMHSVVNLSLPSVEEIADSCFIIDAGIGVPFVLETLEIPNLIHLGSTVGYNYVFTRIIGKSLTITIPAALMTCNSGNPDGDIQYLIDNNDLTIFDPEGNQLLP